MFHFKNIVKFFSSFEKATDRAECFSTSVALMSKNKKTIANKPVSESNFIINLFKMINYGQNLYVGSYQKRSGRL